MKKAGFLLTLCMLAGCASMQTSSLDWIPIGPEFSPNKDRPLQVIASAKEITQPYTNIGMLRVKNLKPDREIIKMGMEKGKKFVAEKGADAVLVGQYNTAADGAQDPRITLIMYAVKYLDTVNDEDIKAMEEFEALGVLNEGFKD